MSVFADSNEREAAVPGDANEDQFFEGSDDVEDEEETRDHLAKAREYAAAPIRLRKWWFNGPYGSTPSSEMIKLMIKDIREFWARFKVEEVTLKEIQNQTNDGGGDYDEDQDDEYLFTMEFKYGDSDEGCIRVHPRDTGGCGNYYDNKFYWNDSRYKHFSNLFKQFKLKHLTYYAFVGLFNEFLKQTYGRVWDYSICYEGYDEILGDVSDEEEDGGSVNGDDDDDDDEDRPCTNDDDNDDDNNDDNEEDQ